MWAAESLADGTPRGLRELDWENPPFAPVKSSRAQAFRILLRLAGELGFEVGPGRLRHLGGGVSHEVYLGHLVARKGELEVPVVVRIPIPDPASRPLEPPEAYRQLRLLETLCQRGFPVQLPRTIALIRIRKAWASVQTVVEGIGLPVVRERSPQVVAEAAALCHRIAVDDLSDWLEPCASRRQFALEELRIIEETQVPGGKQALKWASQNLPPEEPCRLVHGDLLPQNLIVDFDWKLSGILDWDYARLGDPAYDLAVVTRGVARPFQMRTGLRDLLQAYNRLAATPISPAGVHIYELCVRAHEYSFAVADSGRKSRHAEQVAHDFASLLRRIQEHP